VSEGGPYIRPLSDMSHHLKLVCLLPACNQLLCCQRRTNGFPGTGGGMSKLSRLLCLMHYGEHRHGGGAGSSEWSRPTDTGTSHSVRREDM